MAEPAVAVAGLLQEGDGLPDDPAAVDPGHRADGLWRLFETAHARTQALIVDYAERTAAKGAAARRLRIAALSLSVLGVLAPGLANLMAGLPDGWPIGYALLALAGGLALYDQVFGASRSWLRERRAQARLEALAISLRYAWAVRLAKSGSAITDAATVNDLADLILAHVTAVEALTEPQAGAWGEPFRSQLAALEQAPKSTAAAAQAPP